MKHKTWHVLFEWMPRKQRGDVNVSGIATVKNASYFTCRICGCFLRYDLDDTATYLRLKEAIENM